MLMAEKNIVIAVDGFQGWELGTDLTDVRALFKERIKNKMIIWFSENSPEAQKYMNYFKVNFIFIDGLHEYDSLVKDITWENYLRNGGIIAFHDYTNNDFPGVKKFVDEIIRPKYSFIKQVGSIVAFRKL